MESLESMKGIGPEFDKMLKKLPFNKEKMKSFLRSLAKDIVQHKTRLGGTFVIAYACPTKEMRDSMREIFGSQCTFVTLRLTKGANLKRIENRHASGNQEMMGKIIDLLAGMYDLYEDAQTGEDNCVTVTVDADDTLEDVTDKILDFLQ